MDIPTEIIVGLGGAIAIIGASLSGAVVALWRENKALTARILQREDAREMKREAVRTVRAIRRDVEAQERGVVSVPPVRYDDRSDVLEVAWHEDKAWVQRRAAERTPTAPDQAREVLAGHGLTPHDERRLERYSRTGDPSTPPEALPGPPRGPTRR